MSGMREHTPKSMWLPDGKTCSDCVHLDRCVAMFGGDPNGTACDWSPSRFTAAKSARGAM